MVKMSEDDSLTVVDRLRVNLGRHETRASLSLDWAVTVGESLRKNFDSYARNELDDLREQTDLLQGAGYDLEKEAKNLNALELRFEKTNNQLNLMLQSAKEGKLKSIRMVKYLSRGLSEVPPLPKRKGIPLEDFEIDTLIDGFMIIGELEELRKDVERWTETYIRNIETTVSVVKGLRKRGEI